MSQSLRNFWALPVFFFSLVVFTGPTSAQHLLAPPKISPASVENMKTLLVQLWEPGQENRNQAEALFKQIPKNNPELALAYAANRLNDGRRRDALAALDSVVVEHPKFLDGWLMKVHLDVLVDQFDKGLVGLRSAKLAFDDDQATQPQRTEFYSRTGKLIGYLQGPVASRVDQNLLNVTIDQLILGASDPDIATFQSAAKSIRDQFSEKTKTSQDRLGAELQKRAVEDVQLQTTLATQNQNLTQSEQAMRDRMGQLQTEFSQRDSQLTSQLSPLQSSVLGLEIQIQPLQLSLQYLYSDLARIQNQPVVCQLTVRLILDQINRTEYNLFSLQSSYQSYVAQYQSVQSQIQSTRNQYQGQINEIQRELKRINGTVARNNNKLGQIAGGPKISSGKKEVETSRVTALHSYLKLPAQLVRQELLQQINAL